MSAKTDSLSVNGGGRLPGQLCRGAGHLSAPVLVDEWERLREDPKITDTAGRFDGSEQSGLLVCVR